MAYPPTLRRRYPHTCNTGLLSHARAAAINGARPTRAPSSAHTTHSSNCRCQMPARLWDRPAHFLNTHSPSCPSFQAPSLPIAGLRQQPRRYAPPPGRPPPMSSVRQQSRYALPLRRPRAVSTLRGLGSLSQARPASDGCSTCWHADARPPFDP